MEGLREHRKPWRVLEFYSGIGGMRYSLIKAGVDAEVVEAFDINNIANDVYEHNFGHRPHQGNIQTLSAVELDRYEADAWLLSPPCQPYTRQGLQKGSGDARASSFLKILELISESSRPPLMLFVENVVGFEVSDTHKMMKATLRENHYETQEFILSPLQFGVPYSRPRYFCLAKRKPLTFRIEQYNNQLRHAPEFILECDGSMITTFGEADSEEYWDSLVKYCLPVKDFLVKENFSGELTAEPVQQIEKESGTTSDTLLDQYQVPQSLVERLGSAMDIVFPESRRCCCFTKSYFRYVKGTGSVMATISESMKDKVSSLTELHLRYFTPREVANLHSFPDDFLFPEHVSLRQRYTLLGNSLSVGVVAPLFRYLFSSQAS